MRDRLSRIIILLTAVFLTACTNAATNTNATPTPIPTPIVPNKPVYEVQRGDIVKEQEFFGRIAPVEEKELFFREGGFVKNVYFAKGDTVTAGQVIAELENLSDLTRQKALSQFQVRLAELDLADAKLDLELFELSLPETNMLQANALQAVNEAEKALQDAQNALLSYNSLTGSAIQLDKALAESNLEVAQIALTNAQAEYERLQRTPYPIGYQEELIVKQNAVERAQINVDLIKLDVEDLDDAITDAQIMAPFDGQILFLGISEGRTVEAFERSVVIANTSALEVRAELTGSELNGLSERMPVRVELFNAPGAPVDGTIRQLPSFSSSSDATQEVDTFTHIQLAIPPADSGFELNDRVRIRVILEQKVDVLWLPPQGVRSFEGRNFVVIQEVDGERRIDIKLGLITGDRVEILPLEGVENISEGQKVVGP